MKARSHLSKCLILIAVVLLSSSAIVAQQNAPRELSIEEQQALDLLKMLARELKSETDKPAAGRLLARIADQLWVFDEPFAREIFRWSFDAVSQRVPDALSQSKRSAYLARQATAVNEVLRRFLWTPPGATRAME